MERALEQQGLVGAVWSTLSPEHGIAVMAAGRRSATPPAPMRPDDRVQVGSVAKTLVATGILRLVTEGKLRLDDPVSTLLPAHPIHNPWAADHPLRLHHLLDHTAGLDDARLWQLFNDAAHAETPLAAGFDPTRLRLVVRHPPGERFSYSNTSYGLLGLVIERVTGERYEAWLDRHLLTPLGMAASTFDFVSQTGPRADSTLAMGHFEKATPAPAVPTYLRPAMQFTTTARDMALFARFLMSDGTTHGQPFIATELLRAMGAPRDTEAARAGLEIGYALGLGLRDRQGVVGRCHGGNTVGYRAMLCVYPAQQKAFFVAMNADSEGANYARLDSMVMSTLRLERDAPAPVATVSERMGRSGVYAMKPARFEMFRYLDATLDVVRVRVATDHMAIAPLLGSATRLEPVGPQLFRAPGRTMASHVLLTTPQGAPAFSDGHRTFERVSWPRMLMRWAILATGLLGLLYIVVIGLYRVARGRLRPADPLLAPWLAMMALLLAGAALTTRSMVVLGATSTVNVVLAVVTGLLPLALAFGLWQFSRQDVGRRAADGAAMAALLLWTLALAMHDLLPLRLWA